MINKNIVRHMFVGKPVIIGVRTVKEEKPQEEVETETVAEQSESEIKPEKPSGIPQEILDKVFAEIEEIERKEELTAKVLSETQELKAQAAELKKDAEEIKKAAQQEAQDIKAQADELKAQAEDLKSQAEEIKTLAQNQAKELEKQAQDALAAAQKESDKIVADTKKDAEKLLAKVQKEGYDAGYKEGKEQGIKDGKEKIQKELDDTIKQANAKAQKTIQDAKEQTAEYFIRAEDDIAKVVMMAIEKILPEHFLKVPQVILPVIREAISHVRDQKEVKIHVEPYSYDWVLMARAEFQAMLTDGTAILEVVSDEALKPGDCVIETPNGGVDARLSTQIDLMKKAVQSVMNK